MCISQKTCYFYNTCNKWPILIGKWRQTIALWLKKKTDHGFSIKTPLDATSAFVFYNWLLNEIVQDPTFIVNETKLQTTRSFRPVD